MRAIAAAVVGIAVSVFAGAARAADGGAILFYADRFDDFGWYVANADGSGVKRLPKDVDWRPSWTSDGRGIAWPTETGIAILKPDGSVEQIDVGVRGYRFTLSPDGTKLAYVPQGGSAIAIADLVTHRVQTVPPPPSTTYDDSPVWSPNSKLLSFTRGHGLYVVSADGSRLRSVAGSVKREWSWSPDSKRLVYTSETRQAAYVVRADGRRRRQLLAHADAGFAWSPRGDLIAIWGGIGNQRGLFVAQPNGRYVRLLLESGSSYLGQPSWSPDGRSVAVGGGDVFVVDVVTGSRRNLASAADYGYYLSLVGWNPRGVPTSELPGTPFTFLPPPVNRIAGPRLVETVKPVTQLAADGSSVAFVLAPGRSPCANVWDESGAALRGVPLNNCRPPLDCCHLGADALAGITLAGDTVAWSYFFHFAGLDIFDVLFVRPGDTDVTYVDGADCPGGAGPDCLMPMQDLVGDGGTIVFDTWAESCDYPSYPMPCATQTKKNGKLYRADGAKAILLASSAGGLTPLSVDGDRILVDHGDGTLELLGRDGTSVRSFSVGAFVGAGFQGADLVVQRDGSVDDYDAATGALRHTWPLPAGAHLDGVYGGLAAFDVGTTVHILALADGSDRTIAVPGGAPVHAALDSGGLFYSYTVDDADHPGRVAFIPLDELR